ncbi:MAG: PfkB family carbohydrate kinase, partial [Rhodoferax sp.]
LQSHQALLAQADVWVVDANLADAALAALFAAAGHATAGPSPTRPPAVFADAVSSAKAVRLQACLPRIHTLKLNRQEAAALLGQPVQSTADALQAAQTLHQQGTARIVLSLGADGLCWCDADGSTGHLAANPVRVVNSNGAGDALLAGLVLGHWRGDSLPQAARLGLACAEATLQSPLANALVLGAL